MSSWITRHLTPPARLRGQVLNSAGGHAWAIDDWTRLDRFLILGAEGGSYYASERRLTLENAEALTRCVAADGRRVVARVAEIVKAGRAPKPEPALFALAFALKRGDAPTRAAAGAAVAEVCRTGTQLFQLAELVQALGGWGRGTRRAFGAWYADRAPGEVAFQAMKYQQREGWSHRDLLRLSKPKGFGPETAHGAVFHWITRGVLPEDTALPGGVAERIGAFEAAKTASAADTIGLVERYGLPREAVRSDLLRDAAVWDALLHAGDGMPLTALLRNLGKMTAVGLLTAGSEASRTVARLLRDAARLRRARVHPLAVLVALKTYASGRGVKGSLTWTPVPLVQRALDDAFRLAFGAVPRTGKRWLLGCDVSGSMQCGQIAGLPGVSPHVATGALALVTTQVEEHTVVTGFTAGRDGIVELALPRDLEGTLRTMSGLPFGGTDCALPMLWARARRLPVDVFVVLTDNETWAGRAQPVEALRAYRDAMGIPARLVVVGMVANPFTIADPHDAGMLDVVGFDTAAPGLMASFACGEV